MSRFYILVVMLFGFMQLGMASSLDGLRYLLNARSQEPKIFLPDNTMLGKATDIWMQAPGATKLRLYGATTQGELEVDGAKLALGEDYKEIASFDLVDNKSQEVKYTLNLDKEKDAALDDKSYYVEALVTYVNPQTAETVNRRASLYGSNGVFTNNNAIKVLPEQKDSAQVMNMARSFIPGLMNQTPTATSY